jgi:hypothetical protein
MLTDVEVLRENDQSETETEEDTNAFRLYDNLMVRTGRFGNDTNENKVIA